MLALIALAAGCADTGQKVISVPLHVRGGARTADVNGWHVELAMAQVGFGPAYFCASVNADLDLCPTAVVEMARTVTVDALGGDVEREPLEGVDGTVRGAMYDWGVSWFLTHKDPAPNAGAPGGHSLLLAGTATKEAQVLTFTAAVDVQPSSPGAPAVRAQHTTRKLDGVDDTLTIVVDATPWVAGIDFDALTAQGSTNIDITAANTTPYSALVNGMVSASPATFEWSP